MTVIHEEEEESECLMNYSRAGGLAKTVMVVEYLESSMSRDLLGKFPDNSAFDFDYSQSSIWSPLIPRHYPSFVNGGGGGMARQLRYGDEDEGLLLGNKNSNFQKVKKNIKRKLSGTSVASNLQIYHKNKAKKIKTKAGVDFSPNYSSSAKKISSSTSTSAPLKRDVKWVGGPWASLPCTSPAYTMKCRSGYKGQWPGLRLGKRLGPAQPVLRLSSA
ncbi:hypothetical protein RJ639_021110 [Escallonia herrerae]|uniref:Uncharacterized protein n=1 Tax=Escallonia herrerae TaxID=1293975 RepID=A0AA88V2F5_9ASTE|nr:hypothetical protein RJ639_021110 [Escallonia herrerae]